MLRSGTACITPITDQDFIDLEWDYDYDEIESTYDEDNFINKSETNMKRVGIDYEYDIKEKCNVPVDEDIFKKAEANCDFAGFDSFSLNKTNSESFYYLLNVYYNLMCEVNLIDENFNDQTEESFKELIRDKQEKGMPTVVQFIYYVNQ